MKKKLAKEVILGMALVDFNIRPLTLWVTRPRRQYAKKMDLRTRDVHRNRLVGDELVKAAREADIDIQKEIKDQPETVGQLVKRYYYLFPGQKRCRVVNLGDKPISALKKKLVELGLTPDDWPALAPHDELLVHLSKPAILQVPVNEIITDVGRARDFVHEYLGCSKEEVATKTIRDLIQVNPLTVSYQYGFPGRFFKEHKRWFVFLRQLLVKKGLSVEDGQLFAWNPEKVSLEKARNALKKHKLKPSELQRFARIAVTERWVI